MVTNIVDFLDEEFERMDTDHQARKKARVEWHRIFRGKLDKKQENINKSRLVINRTKVAVMHGVANIIDIVFANSDFFDVVGRTDFDHLSAMTIKKVTTWLVEIGDFIEEATRYILQAAIYGTAFGKIVKESVVEVSVDRSPIMNMIRRIVGYKKHYFAKQINYSSFKTVDNDDMWIDPSALSIEDASGMFHRFRRTYNYMAGQGIYSNLEDLKNEESKPEVDKRRQNVSLPQVEPPKGELEFYEYHGKIPADVAKTAGITVGDDETEVECIVTWNKDKKLIHRAERNTFPGQQRMFIRDVWELSGDKDLHGRGVPENVRGPQMALNATVNLRLDNKAWAIAHPMGVDVDGLEDENDLIARVNWIIRCRRDPRTVLYSIPIPDITAESMAEERDFERIINDESGVSGPVQATQSFGSNRTAQGISIAFSAASRPVRMIARGFERNLIAKGLKKLYTMFLMDMNEEVLIRITDDPRAPEYLKVDPMSLSLNIDFIPKGTSALASREAVAQNLVQFAQAMASMPPQVVASVNWQFLVHKFYESLFGSADWDKVWLGGETGAQASQAAGAVGPEGVAGEAAGTGPLGILGGAGAGTSAGEGGGEGPIG